MLHVRVKRCAGRPLITNAQPLTRDDPRRDAAEHCGQQGETGAVLLIVPYARLSCQGCAKAAAMGCVSHPAPTRGLTCELMTGGDGQWA